MQEQNKNNAIFIGGIILAALAVFFTVVMLTYVGGRGLWSTFLPLVAEGYGLYGFIKRIWKYNPNNREEE